MARTPLVAAPVSGRGSLPSRRRRLRRGRGSSDYRFHIRSSRCPRAGSPKGTARRGRQAGSAGGREPAGRHVRSSGAVAARHDRLAHSATTKTSARSRTGPPTRPARGGEGPRGPAGAPRVPSAYPRRDGLLPRRERGVGRGHDRRAAGCGRTAPGVRAARRRPRVRRSRRWTASGRTEGQDGKGRHPHERQRRDLHGRRRRDRRQRLARTAGRSGRIPDHHVLRSTARRLDAGCGRGAASGVPAPVRSRPPHPAPHGRPPGGLRDVEVPRRTPAPGPLRARLPEA